MTPSYDDELARSVEAAICHCEQDPCICDTEPDEDALYEAARDAGLPDDEAINQVSDFL